MKVRFPLLHVALAFVQAGTTSGIIFGWPALQMILTQAGAFSDYCTDKDMTSPCDAQLMYFNTIYTVGIFANNISSLFTGVFLDRFGPKWTSVVSFLLFFGGCALFALNQQHAYVLGYALLGFSGIGIYVAIMHLNNLFPGHQSLVLSVFSGTFTVSSLIFKIFALLYNPDSWFTLPHLFTALIVLLIPLVVLGTFVWPNKPYDAPNLIEKKGLLEEYNSSSAGLKNSQSLYNTSVKKQLTSGEFWCPVVWISLQALHIHSYVGTVNVQFADYPEYVNAFNWIWLGGVVAIPLFGVMLDKKGTTFSFFVFNTLFLLFSICTVIPVMRVQYLSFFMVSIANVGVWGVFYSYLSFVFGTKNYGKILGVAFAVMALVGLLQYALLQITVSFFNSNFFYNNVFFLAISVLLFFNPIYLWRRSLKKPSLKLMDDVTDMMPNDDEVLYV